MNNPGHGGKEYTAVGEIPVMVLFVDGHIAGPFLYDDDFGVGKKVLIEPN